MVANFTTALSGHQKRVGEKEAANSDGAGQAAWHGWSLVARWAHGARPDHAGLGSIPDDDTRSQDKQPPRRVPRRAQQRGVPLAGQNPGDVQASAVEKRWWSEESRLVLTINRYYRG